MIKWMLCLVALLTPLGSYAVVGFDGPTWYDYRDTSFDVTSKGTFDNPIVITAPEQLAQVAYLVNETKNDFTGKVVVLGADINLKKEVDGKRVQWIPIGYNGGTGFKGFFLGIDVSKFNSGSSWTSAMSHTVSGMYINAEAHGGLDYYYGLFGNIEGFIGYVRLTDSAITAEATNFPTGVYVGLLCGRPSKFVYNASVEGNINISSRGRKTFVGGIAGYVGVDNGADAACGIAHSTFKGQIDVVSIASVGGICGEIFKGRLTDCASDVNIKVTSNNSTDHGDTGGIVGYLCCGGSVNACTSTGTVSGTASEPWTMHVGGIVGQVSGAHSWAAESSEAYVTSCASSCTVEGTGNVGGIMGWMAGNKNTHITRCAFNGHIKGGKAKNVGGIAGAIRDGEIAADELVSRCLMLGTMEPSTVSESYSGAIAGDAKKSKQTIANCYYDRMLFDGLSVGTDSTHITIKGLTTYELTTGQAKDVPLLDIDEKEQSRFTLRKGYYPTVYSDEAWGGIANMEKPAGDSEWLKKMFVKENVDQSNTVYRYGAWLCSVPAIMPKGDAAFDLVSQVRVLAANGTWKESNRTITVEATAEFPESAEFLKIDGKTAKVIANGEFDVCIGGKLTKKADALFNRPAPLISSKTLHFTATPEQVWDGTVAEAYAAGTGVREDPYIIKNGAQLGLAVTSNKEGECFKLIADINLNDYLFTDSATLISNVHGRNWVLVKNNVVTFPYWEGIFDGNGHVIRGLYVTGEGNSLFGDVKSSGIISNLGVADASVNGAYGGVLARNMDGKVSNCLIQGVLNPTIPYGISQSGNYGLLRGGGICATVGPNNPNAVIEDCITAVVNMNGYGDYTPFVRLSDDNKGVVRNCLSVVPTFFYNSDWSHSDNSAAGHNYIKDCYWLKGYEHNKNGFTLDEINQTLGQREQWELTANYFPTLKTFAETDIAKLLMVPVRTDAQSWDIQMFDGFTRHLEFEPGLAEWTVSGESIELDDEMGVIVPKAETPSASTGASQDNRKVKGIAVMKGKLGKATAFLPIRTGSDINHLGITFEDENAQRMFVKSFDTNKDGNLSLDEVSTVTAEQFTAEFPRDRAMWIKTLPELRFFKGITNLTTQLNGFEQLEQVRLPYALETIGSHAFNNCMRLTEVTLPAKVSNVKPYAFYESGITNIYVDPFNKNMKSRDGILFDANNGLVAYPSKRGGEDVTISGAVSIIYEGALYRIEGMKRLYLDLADYEPSIPELEYGGIETTDGSLVEVYVKDPSEEHTMLDEINNDPSWGTYSSAKKLFRYYPLVVGNNKAATMYVGFDIKLPEELTPYIVSSTIAATNVALLQEMERNVPKLSPVVILASEPGLYHLYPMDGAALKPWKMYKNRLNGSGAEGIPIYAEDSHEGGIYSLQTHKEMGIPYFDFCQEEMFPPYKAYLPYNSIGDQLEMGVQFLLSQEVNVNDLQFYVIPKSSPIKGQAPEYFGVLSDYDGTDHNIVVPASFKASILGASADEVAVEALASNIFAEPKGEIWSVDFTKITKPLKAYDLLTGKESAEVIVDRSAENNPFWGLDKQAYIYMNSAAGVGQYETNVIIDGKCDYLDLISNRDFLPPFDVNAEIMNLGRTFSADLDDYHRSVSKAFSICLPFTTELNTMANLYTLKSVDEKTHRFVFVKTNNKTIEAGKPYILTVDTGMVQISKANISLNRTINRTGVKAIQNGNTLTDCGYWDGSYAFVDNATAAASNTYVLQSDGSFRRVREKLDETGVTPFQAFFTTGSGKAIDPSSYTMVLCDESDLYAENAKNFPAGAYESTVDMASYDVAVSALWCAGNNTLYFTGEGGYEPNGKYDGQTITSVWSGYDLLNMGKEEPGWSKNASKVNRVVFNSNFAPLRPKTLHAWFKGMSSLKTIEGLENLNTSMTKDMSQMFMGCSSLEKLDLSNFAVNVSDATQMFKGCTSLTTIFTENSWTVHFDGDDEMFDNCFRLVGARTYEEGYTDNYWANSVVGYFTPTPYAIWCASNATLYFAAPGYMLDVEDNIWDSQDITTLWKGFDVAYSNTIPAWVLTANEAEHVVFDETFAKVRPRNLSNWFFEFEKMQQIEDLQYLNTSEATAARYMFFKTSLHEVDVNGFDMSKMANTELMFAESVDLTTIWCNNTWKVFQNAEMFGACTNLKGAVAYSEGKRDGDMANPTTGYFTAIPTVELKDGQDNYDELFAKYDGKRVNIRYDRKFTATQMPSGAYKRKAYSVCLPYDKNLYKEHSRGQMSLYTMASATNDGTIIFAEYQQAELKAGVPYILVVNEGEVNLDADYVKLSSKLDEGLPVYATFDDWVDQNADKQVGLWKGIFTTIYPDDAPENLLYAVSSNGGSWFRFKAKNGALHYKKLIGLRGIFESTVDEFRVHYEPKYGYMPDGTTGARQILDFPAEEFDGDAVETDVEGIQTLFGADDAEVRYFDLQGRQLNSKPTKGIYIEVQNGLRVTKSINK